jgi:hypothetical protein
MLDILLAKQNNSTDSVHETEGLEREGLEMEGSERERLEREGVKWLLFV